MRSKRRNVQSAMKMAVAGTLTLSLLCAPLASAAAAEATGMSEVSESVGTGSSGGTAAPETSVAKLDSSEAKVTKEEAEAKLRALFPVLEQARLERVEFGNPNVYPPRDEAVWNFQWLIDEGNSSYGFSTTVDALNGDVLNYHRPYGISADENQAYYPPKVSEDEAEEIAEAFIGKASPSVNLSDVKPGDRGGMPKQLFGPVQYHFYYQVTKNGIPSNSETVSITVNGNGEIIDFNRHRYEGEYPSAVPALTKKQAEERIKNNVSLTLSYISDNPYGYNRSGSVKWKLAYVPVANGSMLDATTGELIGWDGKPAETSANYLPLPAEGPVFQKNEGTTLTSEQAAAIVTEHAAIPEDYRMNAHLDRYWMEPGVQVWNISWRNQNISPFGFPDQITAYVDAATGRLLSLNRHNYYPSPYGGEEPKKVPAPSITEQEADTKAMELIRLLYPNAAEELKRADTPALIESETSETKFRYQFQRFYGDYPIHGDTVHLTLDGNGKLYSYQTPGTSLDTLTQQLEGLTAQISAEEALRTYADALSAELQYVRFGGYYNETMNQVPEEMKLVYTPVLDNKKGYAIVDASTGKLESYYSSNLPEEETAMIPQDVEDHWASSALTAMIEHGVMKAGEDGLLHPNDELSLGDWILLMSRALYGDSMNYYGGREQEPPFADVTAESEYYFAVQRFIDRRWLDKAPEMKLEPGQTLTRDRLAVTLTRMLNYNKLAEFMNDDLEVAALKDADRIRNKGAAAVVFKLGLLKPSNGKFNPDAPVTKAQAATIIMRLVTLQGKTDSAIF
ncbi:YcdB/YcdC domain-containing protein [Paenibacillus tarimensis]